MISNPHCEQLIVSVAEHVATITINRPERLNALDLATTEELHRVALWCDESPEIRAVVLTGSGRVFCAGGDLVSFTEAPESRAVLLKQMTTYLHAAISRFNRMDAPVIAAVNGVAAGAGFSLMLSTDLAVAAQSASFTMAYTKAGLTPDGSSSFFLPRIVGVRRAHELTLTNRVLTAPEALELGTGERRGRRR